MRTKFIWSGSQANNAVGPMNFDRFLPVALAQGRYRAASPVEVAGDGLDAVPSGLEQQRLGVPATKMVVRL